MRYQKPRWLASYPIRMNHTRTRRFGAVSVNGDPVWKMSGKVTPAFVLLTLFRCRFLLRCVFFFIHNNWDCWDVIHCVDLGWCRRGIVECEMRIVFGRFGGFWGVWDWYFHRNVYWKLIKYLSIVNSSSILFVIYFTRFYLGLFYFKESFILMILNLILK